ncbi:hypothetical protein B4U78_008595 [Microbacterium esteraromaticum]|nr:hypothetical protein B4U78_008595 [Microbacterium esteraromaticum]
MVREIDGRGFAFEPRSMVFQPKAFGMAPGLLEPAHGVTPTDERYRAAMLQHLMAVAAKGELLKSEGISPAAFVARFDGRGLGADRVRRIFRGETMAQLTDLMFWITQLPAVAVAISEYIDAPGDGDSGGEVSPDVAEDFAADEVIVAEEPASSEPHGLVRYQRENSARQAHEAAGLKPEQTRLQKLKAARERRAGAPEARRTPQNPYESSPRRMR